MLKQKSFLLNYRYFSAKYPLIRLLMEWTFDNKLLPNHIHILIEVY